MADSDVVQQLEERAKEAESAIELLKNQLQGLKEKAEKSGLLKGREEVVRLRKENEDLRQEICSMKKQLTDLESTNKRFQVALPVPGQKPPHYPNPPAVTAYVQGPGAQPATVESEPVAAVLSVVAEGVGNGEEAKSKKKEKKKQEKKDPSPVPSEGGLVNVSRLNIKVGRILSVKQHPDADTLYVEEVNVGEEKTRNVVSGLVKHVPIDQMQDRLGIFLVNLKPAKMRGIFSEAMIMCAESPDNIEIIDPPPGSVPGDRVLFEGYSGEPDEQLNPKKKVWDRIRPDLTTNSDCVATYKGVPFTVPGKGICKVPTLANAIIK